MKIKLKLTLCLTMFCALMTSQTHAQTLSRQAAQKAVGARSRVVLRALKNRDMTTLSRYVHPKLGLRFSAYKSVDSEDRVFSARQIRHLKRDKKRYFWGYDDNSAEPIRLTWNAYRKRFVFPVDYTRAKSVNYNDYSMQLKSFYANAIFVHYHILTDRRGRAEWYNDWHGLWLVWNRSGKTWKLVGIANDEWVV